MISLKLKVPLFLLLLRFSSVGAEAQELFPVDCAVNILGRGDSGTVVELVVRIAAEDRALVGNELQLRGTLSSFGEVVDDFGDDVVIDPGGRAAILREWKPGSYHLKVTVSSFARPAIGFSSLDVTIPESDEDFRPPVSESASSTSIITLSKIDAVHFISLPVLDRLSDFPLQVEVPEGTASVEFYKNSELLIRRTGSPWSVRVQTRDILKRSRFRAVALDAVGRYLSEDVIVINSQDGDSGIEILIAPDGAVRDGRRPVTVAVTDRREFQQLILSLDDQTVAKWNACPCVAEIPVTDLEAASILSAEIIDTAGNRFVEVSKVGTGFGGATRVDLVELQVQVLDGKGAPVLGLSRQDFSVSEDGEEIEIDGVGTTADQPLSLVLAVDESGSMGGAFSTVRQAVTDFAHDLMMPGDQVALIGFSSNSDVLVSWSSNPEDIRRGLDERLPAGRTSLHDAIIQSLMQIRDRRGRKALVLLTDGEDTSSASSFPDTEWFARSMRVPIFIIKLGGKNPQSYARMRDMDDVRDRHRLTSLAKESGGLAFFQILSEKLPEVYGEISELLRSQYVIWYRPDPNKSLESFRSIKVRVNDRKLKVRTISGYYPGR